MCDSESQARYCLCCSYEVVVQHKDTKGQLMSLQQTLRQEIHAKVCAQTAEESAKRKVADLTDDSRMGEFAKHNINAVWLTCCG